MAEQLWWVRLPTGEEFGPISTSSLERLIEKGMVTATDEVGTDPEKVYVSLSKTNFYPLLNRAPEFAQYQEPTKEEKTEEIQKSISKTIKTGTIKNQTTKFGTVQVSVLKTKSGQSNTKRPDSNFTRTKAHDPTRKSSSAWAKTIELRPRDLRKIPKDVAIKIVLAIAILSSLVALLIPEDQNYSDEAIHLVGPKENSRQLNEAQLEEIYTKARSAFETDTFGGYLFAMNQLVSAAESVNHKTKALSLLCLTYFELWPFSFRDSDDLSSVTKLAQMTAKTDPAGADGGTCRIVQQILNGRLSEANNIIDAHLADYPGVSQLYMLKARVLEAQENYVTAAAYAQKTEQLWPAWAKPFVKESFFLYRAGQASEAANRLRELVKNKPKHTAAKIILGIIEFNSFRHIDTAIELLKPALSSGEPIETSLKAEGAFALASAYKESQDRSSAIDWAKTAYTLDPLQPGLKEFLVGLAGEKVFDGISKSDREHISLGDQYFLSANYLSAQAHFKMAYDANPQNSTAAYKAGLSLWKLNQGLEAIEWFKKSVQSDSEKIEAYVAMADVYSNRYDFTAAAAILQKAQKQAAKNYEVYRGFATLALKRNDFKGAISSAKKALSFYDTDMDSTLILARAYQGLNDVREAYAQAARAIELEKTNPEAQSLYGEILADAQGMETALHYLQNLFNTYPKVPEYGISLANLYLKEERIEQANSIISQVVSLNPQNKKALLLQGQVLSKLGKVDDALASYLAAAALDPSDGEPLFLAGYVYLDAGQPLSAVPQFERVLIVCPNFPKVRLSLGKAALLMGDRERALREVAAEKKINPNLADPYLLAGDIQMDLKNYPKAVLEYQAALKLRPVGADVYIRMARAYRLSNSFDQALSMLRAAENRESGNAEIAKEYGAVYELKSDNMAAVKFYNRYLQILPNAPDRSAIVDRINQLGGVVE